MRQYLLRQRGLVPLLLLHFALVSCRHSQDPLKPCDQPLSLSVGSGLAPIVSWTPTCTVGDVVVEKLETNGQRRLAWSVFDARNGIESRIRYGSRNAPVLTLEVGASYRVSVGVIVGGDAVQILAVRDFSP